MRSKILETRRHRELCMVMRMTRKNREPEIERDNEPNESGNWPAVMISSKA